MGNTKRADEPATRIDRGVGRLVVAAGLVAATLLIGAGTGETGVTQVTLCHAVGNGSYHPITVAPAAAISGHAGSHHEGGRDIIPPFTLTQGQRVIHFQGQNWGPVGPQGQTGHDILANGCRVPSVPAPTANVATSHTTATTVADSVRPTSGPTPTAVPGQVPVPTPTPAPTAVPPSPTQVPSTSGPTPTAVPGQVPVPTPTPAPTAVPVLVPATVAGEVVPPLSSSTQLTPSVDCVAVRSDGVMVTYFSYELTGIQPVRVEWGPDNQLSPRGMPPRIFGPGVHARVVMIETTGGPASWTLAGTTVSSGPETPDCSTIAETPTGSPTTSDGDSTDTTEPDPTGPGSPTTSIGATPDAVESTVPATSTPRGPTPGGCSIGEERVDGDCVPVDAVILSLVDNVVDCDGFATATFAAVNPNGFTLDGDDFVSALTPPHLDGAQPQLIGVDTISTDNGFEVTETFQVRYVTAVTWSVTHHGVTSDISAGTNGARENPDCPLAAIDTVGVPGTIAAVPSPYLATTGSNSTARITLVALLAVAAGIALIIATRRSVARPTN